MRAVKAWSKMGHSWMPNGLSMLGSGTAFRISEWPVDIVAGQLLCCRSATVNKMIATEMVFGRFGRRKCICD